MAELQNRGDNPNVNRPPDNRPQTPSPEVQKNMAALEKANEAKEPKPAMEQEPASGQRNRRPVEEQPAKPEEEKPRDNRTTPPSEGRTIGLDPPGF